MMAKDRMHSYNLAGRAVRSSRMERFGEGVRRDGVFADSFSSRWSHRSTSTTRCRAMPISPKVATARRARCVPAPFLRARPSLL